MDASERFLKFAAECELMANITPSRANKTVWRRMAERWIRCAEFIERQDFTGSRCKFNEASSEACAQ